MVGKPTYEELEQRVKELERGVAEGRGVETSLEADGRRFFSVLEEVPAFIYLQTQDYSIRYANRYFIQHFGETEGRCCYEVLWGRTEPCEVCPTFQVFDTETPQVWEWYCDFEQRTYEIYDYPFTDVDGTSLVLELGIDITERKHSEERLYKMKNCFLSFGSDTIENINLLTRLCGELLGGTCALYNRLEGELLCSLGQWNTPPDYNPRDKPEGHICFDVIRGGEDKVMIVRDLPNTLYAETDPNVIPYNLQTYIGKPVKCGGEPVGSLCVVFQRDIDPNEDDRRVLEIAASAIGVEEERRQAEQALREREATLEIQTTELEEVNRALRVLLKRMDEDKRELEEKVSLNVKELVAPFAEKLKNSDLDAKQMTYLSILESNLNSIVSPFVYRLSSKYLGFTPTEIQVASLVRDGKSTKEIAELLNSSYRTIECHRQNIRMKIGIKKKKANLRSFLLSM